MPEAEAVDWTDAELSQEARCVPLDALSAVLASDAGFVSACIEVRQDQLDPNRMASRIKKTKRGQRVIAELLTPDEFDVDLAMECGASERDAISLALVNVGRRAVGPDSPVDRRRYRSNGTRYDEAARLAVAMCLRRCPTCHQALDHDRLYCSAHRRDGERDYQRDADLEAIRSLLERCADALEIPA